MARLCAPITGSVWKILVAVGDIVAPGDELVILESMKLEIPVEAEEDGTVRRLLVVEGVSVAEGDVLVEIG